MPRTAAPLALLLVAASGGVAGAVWWPGAVFPVLVLLFVAAHAVSVPTPSGVGVSMAPAVAGAAALVTSGSLVAVLGAGAVALPAAVLLTGLLHGRRVVRERFPAEPLGIFVFVAAFSLSIHGRGGGRDHDLEALLLFALTGVVGFLVAGAARARLGAVGRDASPRLRLVRALGDWPAYAVLVASGALFAVTEPSMGPWSLLIAGVPCALGYLSLHRVRDTRRTYDQTIRALGRIPEAGGMAPPGHAERIADLAAATGAELGLGGHALDRLEHAALLHGIGRLALANPAVAAAPHAPSDVAVWSAAIIGEVAHLAPVADLVGRMHDPYRRPGERRDPGLSPEAHVVRVVAAYEEGRAAGRAPVEAIETLHRGAAYDFDPDVVAVLRLVLERRGEIHA